MTTKNTEIFRKIFYDKLNPSFGSPLTLYKAAKKINNSITLNEVKDWLQGEFTYTLHKQEKILKGIL
jgi:hypothetical protein